MPDPADGSVIVGRAPSLIREVETLVDWLQYIFRTQKDVTPADVLVVTPDIEGAAGVIEAVMNAQPEQPENCLDDSRRPGERPRDGA